MSNTIVAIDVGAGGGIALYKDGTCEVIKMPRTVFEMWDYFSEVKQKYENVTVFIEKVQAYVDEGAGGKKFGINKMLENKTELLTIIKLMRFKYVEVHPLSWQSTLKLRWKDKPDKPERKRRYRDYAQNCFPDLKVTLATADAICLVQFALTKISSDINWIRTRLENI